MMTNIMIRTNERDKGISDYLNVDLNILFFYSTKSCLLHGNHQMILELSVTFFS